MPTTDPNAPADETADLAVTAALTIWRGPGPLYFRDTLATAEEGDVRFEITRILPLGLHVRAERGDEVVTIVLAESTLIEQVCAMARDRLPEV